MNVQTFTKLFDHSMLRPNTTQEELIHAAETAASLGTATLTVQPHYIQLAGKILQGSGVLVGTVVGFPHGNETPAMKEFQARTVLDLGAQEIDMVMNIPALKNFERELFLQDIYGVVQVAEGYIVKVILENCYLTEEEKLRACKWIALTGAHFVKTSTAYADGGATLEDVRLMYAAVEGKCRVKAAGGVRTLKQLHEFLKVGASRFGSTRTEMFVEAFKALSEIERDTFEVLVSPVK
jgi:deoxyribose-phosphate aldolase